MDRSELRKLALIRLREAKALLDTRNYSGAYYLAGYAVECGLKACIASQTKRYAFPDNQKVKDSYTHNLVQLVAVAGLTTALAVQVGNEQAFERNWAITKQWSEASRYGNWSTKQAHDLYDSISDNDYGVLQWIKQHW